LQNDPANRTRCSYHRYSLKHNLFLFKQFDLQT